MDWILGLKPGISTIPECDTEDIFALLVAVLPVFTAVATKNSQDLLEASCPGNQLGGFYASFRAVTHILYVNLVRWDPADFVERFSDEGDQVKRNLARVLDELENRFLSAKGVETARALKCLGFTRAQEETYPKLRALRRTLPEDDALAEGGYGYGYGYGGDYLDNVDRIMRIHNSSGKKRDQLLANLVKAYEYFVELQSLDEAFNSHSPCPVVYLDYPLKHVRSLTTTLFQVLQENWNCQCGSAFHVNRKTRFNLTQHQRFETTPTRRQNSSTSEACFRILFPTSSQELEWQDADVSVNSRDHDPRDHERVQDGLCSIIQGVKRGIRPRMVIYSQQLWQMQADADLNPTLPPRVGDGDFRTLGDLLLRKKQRKHTSTVSLFEPKDRLILSFILATSLLHFFNGPWLRVSFDHSNICFVASRRPLSLPDITKPYLTTSFSSWMPKESGRQLNQPHKFPDILSLGILLLEIAREAPINIEEPQDRCVVALEYLEKLERASRIDSWRNVPNGLLHAIRYCVDPKELRNNVLDKKDVKNSEIRKYIFENVVYHLGEALSTACQIEPDMLLTDHSQEKQPDDSTGVGSFDHQEEDGEKRREAAKEWRRYLDGVHELLFECQERCENRTRSVYEETRVKIAVLDSGLTLPGALFENYVDAGRIQLQQSANFVAAERQGAEHDWTKDSDGHGSRVGQMILEFAPAAVLHVAKVFESRHDLADPRRVVQTQRSISEAIDRAVSEWKVDAIVMCFGFEQKIPLIHDAIINASKTDKPPLFFAATGNNGAHAGTAWPAKELSVIGVSSTAADGNMSTFNPPDRDAYPVLYAFGEGVPVEIAAPHDPEEQITKYVTGTSYATPVAAALAANLLGTVRMMAATCDGEDHARYNHVPRDLQRMSGMLAVLRNCMQSRNVYDLESLLPWDFLKVSSLAGNKILRDVADVLEKG